MPKFDVAPSIYNFFQFFLLLPPLTCSLRIFFVSGDFVQFLPKKDSKCLIGHFLTVHPKFFTTLFFVFKKKKCLFWSNLSTAYFIIKIDQHLLAGVSEAGGKNQLRDWVHHPSLYSLSNVFEKKKLKNSSQ